MSQEIVINITDRVITANVQIGETPQSSPYITVVNSLADLPDAVDGVITLEANMTYLIATTIDLMGSRLVIGGIITLLGTSSETSFLKSTGLAENVPLLTSRFTIPIKNLSFKDVHTALYIDNNGNQPLALDWYGVNFVNIPNVGEIGNFDNFILETSAFLNSKGLRFTGTFNTFAAANSLFSGDGLSGDIIQIASTAVIQRRFRIIYSSIVAFGSTIGLNVSTSATIPDEAYILDTINFSGGSTYISGVLFNTEKALFINCVGITNTTAIASLYMKDNATPTVVTVRDDRYAISGNTQVASINQKFSHILANNSVRYDSNRPRLMRVLITFTILSGNNNIIGVYIGVKKGANINPDADRISESEVYITTNGSRPDAGSIQAIVELNQHDEVYMIVQNTSATNDITVVFMNMTIERTN